MKDTDIIKRERERREAMEYYKMLDRNASKGAEARRKKRQDPKFPNKLTD